MSELQIIFGFCFLFSILTLFMTISLGGGRRDLELQLIRSESREDEV